MDIIERAKEIEKEERIKWVGGAIGMRLLDIVTDPKARQTDASQALRSLRYLGSIPGFNLNRPPLGLKIKKIKRSNAGILPADTSKQIDPTDPDFLSTSIEDMDFTVRTYNCLKNEGIPTLGYLIEYYSEEDLLDLQNFGPASLMEVTRRLEEYDLSLKSD